MFCAILVGLLGVSSPGLAAPLPSSTPRLSPGQYALQLEKGRLSVLANDADLRDVLKAIGREHGVEVTIDPEVLGTVTTSFTSLPLKEGLRRLAGSYALLFMRDPASGRENLLKVAVLQEGQAQASASEPEAGPSAIRAPPGGRSRVSGFPTAERVIGGVLREEEKDVEFAPNEVLVKLKDDAPEGAIDDIVRQLDAIILKQYGAIGYYRIELSPQTSVAEAIADLEANPLVEVVEPNYIVHAELQPNDPSFNQLWGLHNTGQTGGSADADIDAPEAWDLQRDSSSIVVAVIDTGVDYNHPDLAANMWTNSGEVPGNGIDDDNNGYVDDYRGWDFINNDNDPFDGHSHGTHVSGTIAAVGDNGVGVVGVNWTARIMALKFLSDGGSGFTSDAVEAVLYAAANGAKVMNNSWGGGGFSQALFSAIQTANNAGSLFIAAAGNSSSNNDSSPHYPSNYDVANVVSVAASTSSDTMASFSSYGATTVDLAAPGVGILSTVPGGGYSSFSGTSMATPHVAGAAALLMAQFPSLSHLETRTLILNTVDPVGAFAGKTVTGGRLNVFTPLGCQSSSLSVSGLTPADGAIVSVNEPTTVTARVSSCGAAVAGATVTASLSSGGTLTLLDDGAHSDGPAGDGVYGASWMPTVEGSVTLTVTASTSGYTSGSASATVTVARVVTYQQDDTIPFEWIDATQGVDLGIRGDDSSLRIDVGFPFEFYGVSQTQVTVSSNGYLTFGTNGTSYVNASIPTSGTPNGIIAPFWDDLNPQAGGAVYMLHSGVGPNRSITIQWHDIPHYSSAGTVTFQVTLYESSNEIVFRYQDVTFDNAAYDRGASATVGVENLDGSSGTQYSYNSAALSAGRAIRLFDNPPAISVSPAGSVDFGTVTVGSTADQSFTVTNTGSGTLTGSVSATSPFSVVSGGSSELLENLVAFWKFDEAGGARNDEIGSNNLADSGGVTQAAGKIGSAAQFGRANQSYLSIPDNTDLSTGNVDFTFAGWVYLDSKPGSMIIAGRTGSAYEWYLSYDKGDDRFRFLILASGGRSLGYVNATSFGSPATGQWVFVVGWHDSANDLIGIQVNDGPADTARTNGSPSDSSATFFVGSASGRADFLDGRIDAAGFWKRLLTAQERTTIYNRGNGLDYPFSASSDNSFQLAQSGGETGEATSSGSFSLRAGATATVVVRFSPTLAQAYSGTVTFTSNGGSASRTVTGTGQEPPALTVSPTVPVDFGTVMVGGSTDQSFTVTNTGSGTLSGTVGASSPFSIVSGGSFSLAAGATSTVVVRFSPTAALSYSGSVSFTSNGGSATRALTGTGEAAPALAVSPSGAVGFGSVGLGGSADRSFTVTNTGGGTVTGTASVSSPFGVVYGGSFSLTAGASSTVVVRFSPSAAQSYSGTVSFTSDGGSASRTVTGTGEAPPTLAVSPSGTVDFGTAAVGSSADRSFTVTNTGGGTLSGTVTSESPFTVVAGGSSGLSEDLVAYWKFDEAGGTRFDEVASNHLADSSAIAQGVGKLGSAARFVRSNGTYLSIPDNVDLSTGDIDFTFAGWVYLDSKPGSMIIAGRTGSAFEWYLSYDKGDDRFRFIILSPGGRSLGYVNATSFGSPSTGRWIFVVAWYDAANSVIGLQVNDGPADTARASGAPYDTSASFMLGSASGRADFFDGRIDSAGFWRRVLSAEERASLYNDGNGLVYPFSVPSSGDTFSLGAGASATVAVRFTPTAAQAYSGTVSITSNGGSASRSVTGTGSSATGPVLSVSPAGSVDFGTVAVGGSADQSFTVSNVGTGTLSGSATASAPFSVVSGGSFSLAGGSSATVTVRFAPTAAQSYSQTVSFASDGGSASRTVTGTGQIGPALSVSPSGSVDFGTVAVGSTADQSFTVTNSGGGTLTGSVSTASPFSVVSGGSYSLAGGASATLVVRFTPTAAQAYSGTASFTSDGGSASRTVTGTGQLAPALSVTPSGSVDFGTVAVGSTADQSFTVTNTGGGTLTGTVSAATPFSVVSGGSSELSRNLVAYWRFEEPGGTRADDVGGNDLADSNVTQAAGKLGSAAQFGRANRSYLSIPDNADLSTGNVDFTFAGWVYLTSKPGSMIIAGRTGSAYEWYLSYDKGDDKFRFIILAAGGRSLGYVNSNSFGSPPTGQWVFVVGWHDSANDLIGIQVNDGPAATSTAGAPSDTGARFILGSGSGRGDFLDGRIDAAGFWKRILTAEERTALYNSGNGLEYPFTGAPLGESAAPAADGTFSLGPGASTTVVVRFTPTAAQAYSGTASFTSNGGSATRTVTGTGAAGSSSASGSSSAQPSGGTVSGTGDGGSNDATSQEGTVAADGMTTGSPLSGRWRAYSVLSGGSVEGWLRGDISIDTEGTVTDGTMTDQSGAASLITGGSVSVSGDGGVSVAIDSPDGTFQVTTAYANPTRDIIVGVGSHDGNPMWMVLVKEAAQATEADLEGLWRLYAAESGGSPIDETLEGQSWGTWSIGASGEVFDGSVTASGGAVHSEALGQLGITGNGAFTGSYTYIEGMEDTIVAASINPQKTFAAGVGYHETLGVKKHFLFVATLGTGSFGQPGIAGTWHNAAVASNPAPVWEGCGTGTVGLDSEGAVTGGSDTECGGAAESLTGGNLLLGADGAITGQLETADDIFKLQQGSVTGTKGEMVMVIHEAVEDRYSLILGLRR